MDDERKRLREQFASIFGMKEFLRFGCAILLWIFAGSGISLLLGGYWGTFTFIISFISMFIFAIISWSWQPAYAILRLIVGRDELPAKLPPRSAVKPPREPLPRSYYIYAALRWIVLLLLFYFVFKYISK